MVRKSYGRMRGTRKKLRSKKFVVTRYITEFKVGENVHIYISGQKRMPHPKFHGLAGKIIAKKGKSYTVKVKDKKAFKTICVRPEHLKR